MEGEIWFYDHKEKPYGVFSNFAETSFTVEGRTYPTSEAYFQSKKFEGPDSSPADLEYAKLVASQNTGNKSAILARQAKPIQNYKWAKDLWDIIQTYSKRGVKMRSDWDKVKNNVMRVAVYHKFNQNPKIKQILLSTGSKPLFEHTHRDMYWADGHPKNDPTIHGEGKNMLGQILEEVRYLLAPNLPRNEERVPGVGAQYIEDGEWLIPGFFLLSDSSNDVAEENGYRYMFSQVEPYGCKIKNNVLIANWRDTIREENKHAIAKTIEIAISIGLPVIMPFSQTEIAHAALTLIYKY